MSEQAQVGQALVQGSDLRRMVRRARWPFWSLVVGLGIGAWIGGGPDRYGEDEGIVGGIHGAGRTMSRCFRFTAATFRDCIAFDRSSVRKLGLRQQIETRLWQDKRLVADDIVVEVEDGGTAILRGIVPDEDYKDRAVTLARDTRGVEKVVDELAIRPSSRTIQAAPAPAVPTGVASNGRTIH